MKLFHFSVIAAALLISGASTSADDKEWLTIDRLFQSEDFQEERQPLVIWSKRSESYFILEAPQETREDKPAEEKKADAGLPPVEKSKGEQKAKKKPEGRDLVRIDLATGAREVLVPAAAFQPMGADQPLSVDGLEFSADESRLLIFTNSKKVWRRNTRGDYWVMQIATRKLEKLGGNAEPATLMFARFSPDGSHVAFVRQNNLYAQSLSNLAITPLTADGSSHLINGTSDWVNEEELDIRDAFRWSPDGMSIAFWQFDTSHVPEFTMVDNTSGTYARTTTFAYPKVGQKNSAGRVGVVDVSGGPIRWLDVPGDPRNHYIARVDWTEDGKQIQLQQFNRPQNQNRVFRADPATGAVRSILTETDEAWIENENPIRWLEMDRFLWISERDGWRHAYQAAPDGSLVKLTPGDFDVLRIEAVDLKSGTFFYSASPDNPTQSYLYKARLDGGLPERLSPAGQPGWHSYNISPDAKWAFHTYSTFNSPPQVDLVRLADHSPVRTIVTNQKLRDSLAGLRRPTAEFLKLDIGEGVVLDAWRLQPLRTDPNQKCPLLMYVYGEPHGQTVRDAWQGTRGLWHLLLAQKGFMVASVDNQGTMSPRGRAFRKCVYKQIGIQASREQATATRLLIQRFPFVDEKRIGVWGWSGGGSMTLNAMLRYPDVYQTGISVAPVADQKLYDTIYQERYMGLLEDNAEGYRNGSPLTFAAQLKGNLLLIHGTGDDNCHYQGTEKLMNELIAHNKPFSAMAYPGRSHSISEGRNTVRHFYALMTDYLERHLLTPQSDVTTPPAAATTGGVN